MKFPKNLEFNKTGLGFAAVALVITVCAYYLLFSGNSSYLPNFISRPLIYLGFALPFISSIIVRGFAGCGLKDGGCEVAGYVGFGLGVIVLLGLYYALGCIVSHFMKRHRK